MPRLEVAAEYLVSDRTVYLDYRVAGREVAQQPLRQPVWSPSRAELEMAIHAEKAKDHADWNPDLQSEEQRLSKRLGKLNLEMKVMAGDGNCQVQSRVSSSCLCLAEPFGKKHTLRGRLASTSC